MKIIDCEQLSAEWFELHKGRVTASNIAKVMAFYKRGDKLGEETKERADYKAWKVAEILTGIAVHDSYVSKDMEFGIEQEPYARAAYEARTGVSVDEVGFILHPTIERAGASPDGLVAPNGGIEIKCARTSTHIKWMLDDVVPEEHEPQMMFNIACAEADYWDFVSFDPRMPRHLQLFVRRLHRDQARIDQMNAAVLQFLSEVDDLIARLNEIAGPADLPPLGKTPRAKLEEQLIGSLTEEDFRGLL